MIQIKDAVKSFQGVPAVRGLNLQIEPGEILGLLGANGAGKSTTIHLLLGFLQLTRVPFVYTSSTPRKKPTKSVN